MRMIGKFQIRYEYQKERLNVFINIDFLFFSCLSIYRFMDDCYKYKDIDRWSIDDVIKYFVVYRGINLELGKNLLKLRICIISIMFIKWELFFLFLSFIFV